MESHSLKKMDRLHVAGLLELEIWSWTQRSREHASLDTRERLWERSVSTAALHDVACRVVCRIHLSLVDSKLQKTPQCTYLSRRSEIEETLETSPAGAMNSTTLAHENTQRWIQQ